MHTTRSAAAAAAWAVAAVAALGTGTAVAHGGTLAVDIAGHERGRVTALVTWENDKDSVDERVAATVSAVSADGTRTAGPWILVRDPADAKRFTTAQALPPGRWKVTVEAGHPALGRDEADITVAAPPPPSAAPASVPSASPPSASERSASAPSASAPSAPSSAAPRRAAEPAAEPVRAGRAAQAADPDGGAGTPWTVPAAAAGALAALGAAALLVVRRRRSRPRR
ncbi:hypothetical protein [Streptomyces sp. NRRL S-118]|uniref:hypothetical protein n=1 Tax=Streptomyces sp. NRRL S-118 TaxID=1463881 RepID=UPI0004C8CE69|nr:hypothetical protein [Streptomyces sp. NRRL S-118]